MAEQVSIAALVPMRHHSERVPQKNYRPLAGAPLYTHIIRTLQACPCITTIMVDTDSPVILQGLQADFPDVVAIERPVHLCAGEIPMNDVLLHDVKQVPADFYLQTHSTNPLLRTETITRAIDTFLASYPEHDSLFSVTALQTRLYDQHGLAINHDPAVLLRTQDLPPVYEENSCIYIFSGQTLQQRLNRLGANPLLFPIPAAEAWDIDEELDFSIVDSLMQQRLNPQA